VKLTGNCMTTAMGILPHNNIRDSFKLAFAVDIPFWPQLPKFSFHEDMYVQVCEHFPGIRVDKENLRVSLETEAFYKELDFYAAKSAHEDYFELSPQYSATLNEFLRQDFSEYRYIRGQNIGPISFGLKITDENRKPIIYNDEIRDFLYEFIAQKVNAQYRQLKKVHDQPFVWVDEPGLEMLFTSFTGYPGSKAKEDFLRFLDRVDGPRGVHLCGNPDWSFLLSDLNLDILSIDIFGNGEIFTRYTAEIKDFLQRGGIISWGIVPTLTEEVDAEGVNTLTGKMEAFWTYLDGKGIDLEMILSQAWLAPARCCLVNSDGAKTVHKSFDLLNRVAENLKGKYKLV